MEAHITLWNSGAEELYGFSREEALGQVSYRLLRTVFPEPYEQIVETLLRDGRWTGELRKFAKDGREIDVATLWILNRDAAGRPISILEVGTDVTERNRLELRARRWDKVFELADFGLAHASKDRLFDSPYVFSLDHRHELRALYRPPRPNRLLVGLASPRPYQDAMGQSAHQPRHAVSHRPLRPHLL